MGLSLKPALQKAVVCSSPTMERVLIINNIGILARLSLLLEKLLKMNNIGH